MNMKLTTILAAFVVVLLGGVKSYAGQAKTVTVEINYGGSRVAEKVEVEYRKGMTALVALMQAADVKTHPVGRWVFVTAVGGQEGVRGDMAWYYTLNGEKPKQVAVNQPLKAGDVVAWRYVKDVCSCTVDKQ